MGESGWAGCPQTARTPVDILIRDMGGDGVGQRIDFTGEVVVFPVHLRTQVVNAVIDIRIHFAEP